MAATVGRGAQMNSMYFKPMLRKAYHKKGSCADTTVKLNGEETKNKSFSAGDNGRPDGDGWWVPDHRTRIYHPKGQEKVIEDVPLGAGKDFRVNWFSKNEETLFDNQNF